MDRTCYYVSPSQIGLAVPDFETAGEKCRQMGSALYEPRTRRGMTMILGAEMDSGDDELHDYAIGMRVDDEGELAYVSDGSRVAPEIVGVMGRSLSRKESQGAILSLLPEILGFFLAACHPVQHDTTRRSRNF